ncbi:MAG: endolytic transglycosylase MltG [Candidatus Zixiibacteriota bacterium]
MDIRAWEYVAYFFVTTFLLLVGLFLLVLGILNAVIRRTAHSGRTGRTYIVLGLALVGLVAGYLYYAYVREVDLGEREVTIVVKTGDRFAHLAARLQIEGVVTSRWLLEYAARWTDVDKRLQPGAYRFAGRNSCRSVLEKIRLAEGVQAKVTIYEGAAIWKVASVLAQALQLDSAELIALNSDRPFLDSLEVPCLEGYLFPETYVLPQGMDARSAAREMVAMFNHQTDSLWSQLRSDGLTRDQIVILASIVQAETKLPQEAGKVASVYQNRLRRGMLLDADPTVIYGLGGLDRALAREDLDSLTPYNTYRVAGLPPTPINSPGLPAIRASMAPDSTGFLYFVADGQGGHHFSYTNDEHNTMRKRVKMAARRR